MRVKSSFLLLDSIQHENIIRIYPHKLFCNTRIQGRCLTHNKKQSFYSDDYDHISNIGAEKLVQEIQKVIFPHKDKYSASDLV